MSSHALTNKSFWWGVFGLLIFLPLSAQAQALKLDLGGVEDLQLGLERLVNAWRPKLEGFATRLLLSLAGISVAWQAILMVIKTPNLEGFFSEVVRIVMFTGFFLAVIQNSGVWTAILIESFTTAAAEAIEGSAKVASLSSTDTLRKGIQLAIEMTEGRWFSTLAMMLLAVPVMIVHALMAGYQLLVLAEMYIVTAAGVLLLGFGGSSWTMDYAKRYIQYCVSIGAKLFTLYLVVGLSHQVYGYATDTINWSASSGLAALGILVMIFMLVCTIPGMVQNIINGGHLSGTGMAAGSILIAGSMVAASKAATAIKPADTKTGGGSRMSGKASPFALKSAAQSSRKARLDQTRTSNIGDQLDRLRKLQSNQNLKKSN